MNQYANEVDIIDKIINSKSLFYLKNKTKLSLINKTLRLKFIISASYYSLKIIQINIYFL